MASEKRRTLYMFYLLATKDADEGKIRSFDLAKSVGVTTRTVKNDIKELSDFARASGCKLCSKKGYGYWLEIENRILFDPVKHQLQIYFSSRGDKYRMEESRVLDIIRRIITEEKYMDSDAIADEMYLTKSTLKKELNEVKDILAWFGMRRKRNNEVGPLVLGSEQARRSVMMFAFEDFYHEATILFKQYDYSRWVDIEESMRLEIRHIFLKELRESTISLNDTFSQRMARYLCLSINRFQGGFEVEPLTKKQQKLLVGTKQLAIAQNVYHTIDQRYNIPCSRNEVDMFAMMLLIRTDILFDSSWRSDYNQVVHEAIKLTDDWIECVKEEYHIDLDVLSRSRDMIASAMVPMVYYHYFGKSSLELITSEQANFQREKDPFARLLAGSFAKVYMKQYNDCLTSFQLIQFATQIRLMFFALPYEYSPVKLAVVDGSGLNSAKEICRIVYERMGQYIYELTPIELYELRKYPMEQFDAVIMSAPDYSYNYDWPYCRMDTLPTMEQIQRVYDEIIIRSIDVNGLLQRLDIQSIRIYRDFEVESISTFAYMMSFKLGFDSESSKQLYECMVSQSTISTVGKAIYFLIPSQYIKENVMEIYQLKQPYRNDNVMAEYMIVIGVDCKNDHVVEHVLHDLLMMLEVDEKNILQIIDVPTMYSLEKIIKKALNTLSISLSQVK